MLCAALVDALLDRNFARLNFRGVLLLIGSLYALSAIMILSAHINVSNSSGGGVVRVCSVFDCFKNYISINSIVNELSLIRVYSQIKKVQDLSYLVRIFCSYIMDPRIPDFLTFIFYLSKQWTYYMI